MPRLVHELRLKYPGLAARADKGQKLACIRLFCVECYGGSLRDARTCPTRDCPLWGAAGAAWSRTREGAGETLGDVLEGENDEIGADAGDVAEE